MTFTHSSTPLPTDLAGKTALVTGGSRGIGKAIVRHLAARGAAVAFSYSASGKEAEALAADIHTRGGKAKAYKADAADSAAVRQLVKDTARDFGHLDILVNNAGVFAMGDISEMDDATYDRLMDINVKAVWAAVQEVVKVMPDGGRIITIGSNAGWSGKPGSMAEYGATKAAVNLLTRNWATMLGKRAITVNVVAPGPIDTDMNPANSPFAPVAKALTVLGRYGTADEIAAAVGYTASPQAGFMTGNILYVDGGASL